MEATSFVNKTVTSVFMLLGTAVMIAVVYRTRKDLLNWLRIDWK